MVTTKKVYVGAIHTYTHIQYTKSAAVCQFTRSAASNFASIVLIMYVCMYA